MPIHRTDEERAAVQAVAEPLRAELAAAGIRVRLDDRVQHRPGYKFAEWEVKGVPVRIELGPRDIAAGKAVLVSRLDGTKEEVAIGEIASGMAARLTSIQQALFADAIAFREANTHQITSFDEFARGVDEVGGFWVGAWCARGCVRGRDQREDEGVDPLPALRAGGPRRTVHPLRQAGGRHRHLGTSLLTDAGGGGRARGGCRAARELRNPPARCP